MVVAITKIGVDEGDEIVVHVTAIPQGSHFRNAEAINVLYVGTTFVLGEIPLPLFTELMDAVILFKNNCGPGLDDRLKPLLLAYANVAGNAPISVASITRLIEKLSTVPYIYDKFSNNETRAHAISVANGTNTPQDYTDKALDDLRNAVAKADYDQAACVEAESLAIKEYHTAVLTDKASVMSKNESIDTAHAAKERLETARKKVVDAGTALTSAQVKYENATYDTECVKRLPATTTTVAKEVTAPHETVNNPMESVFWTDTDIGPDFKPLEAISFETSSTQRATQPTLPPTTPAAILIDDMDEFNQPVIGARFKSEIEIDNFPKSILADAPVMPKLVLEAEVPKVADIPHLELPKSIAVSENATPRTVAISPRNTRPTDDEISKMIADAVKAALATNAPKVVPPEPQTLQTETKPSTKKRELPPARANDIDSYTSMTDDLTNFLRHVAGELQVSINDLFVTRPPDGLITSISFDIAQYSSHFTTSTLYGYNTTDHFIRVADKRGIHTFESIVRKGRGSPLWISAAFFMSEQMQPSRTNKRKKTSTAKEMHRDVIIQSAAISMFKKELTI